MDLPTLQDHLDIRLLELVEDFENRQVQADSAPQLLANEFGDASETDEWLRRQQKLGLLDRGDSLVPEWRLTGEGKARVARARTARKNRGERARVLRTRLLAWVDNSTATVGSLEGRIEQFFLTEFSHFEGEGFSQDEVDDAAGFLEGKGLVIRKGAWGAPTLRIGITSEGRECAIDFDCDVIAFLDSKKPTGTTINVSNVNALAIALGDHSNATATSQGVDLEAALLIGNALREALPVLNLGELAVDAANDLESKDPGRVRCGLMWLGQYASDTSAGTIATVLGTLCLQLLK